MSSVTLQERMKTKRVIPDIGLIPISTDNVTTLVACEYFRKE